MPEKKVGGRSQFLLWRVRQTCVACCGPLRACCDAAGQSSGEHWGSMTSTCSLVTALHHVHQTWHMASSPNFTPTHCRV